MGGNIRVNNSLSQEDIKNLINSPTDKKMGVTRQIAEYYSTGLLEPEQMAIAEKIFRALLKDTEKQVRQTLSHAIKHSNNVPKDIIIDLAKDIEEVSLPVLEFSEVLSDQDLIEIIHNTTNIAKQEAITKRKEVSKKVSEALIDTGNEIITVKLLTNKNASVSEKDYSKIATNFTTSDEVIEHLIKRENLPTNIIESLAQKVSDAMYLKLTQIHHERLKGLDNEIIQTKNITAMKLMGMTYSEQEYSKFIENAKKMQISENAIPISALCTGNINLFEISMARKTKLTVMNVRTLLNDKSKKGFKAIYEKANLPNNLYEATSCLVSIIKDLQNDDEGKILKNELSDIKQNHRTSFNENRRR